MKKYLFIIGVSVIMASCNKWLDVKPESQISEEELFTTETGFMEALNGIYSTSAIDRLYGQELTVGILEVLAQNYSYKSGDPQGYRQVSLYNYKDGKFIGTKDDTWKRMYNAIANCNLIIDRIDKGTVNFSKVNYNIIKGEALALRAYLHLDLLRMFGPSFATEPAAKSIPYVTTFSNKVTPLSTVTEALNKMVEDLTKAKELLKASDPILPATYKVGYPGDTASKELTNPLLFLQNRRHRMNYYAVCGTLARVYLNLDKKQEALANALEVVEAKKFPWTKEADFINADDKQKDRIRYPEVIFGWFNERYDERYIPVFEAGATSFYLDMDAGDNLYEKAGVGAEDLRYKQWFNPFTDASSKRYNILKYKRDKETNRHPFIQPAIRLSEMYYIAAECTWDVDQTKASAYMDSVRNNRGIGTKFTAASKEQFLTNLVKEARKEFYAEGQIFYMYKRLNRSIVGETGAAIPASRAMFVFPLPNDELEYGQR